MILFRPHVSPASLGLRPKKPLERAMFKRSTLTHFLLIDDQQISASTADEIIYGRSLRWQSARPLPERSSRARSSRPDTPTDFVFFLGERIKLNVKSWEADSEKTSRCWSSESFFFPEPPVALFTAAQSSRGTWNAVVTWQLIAPVTCSYLLLCWWRPHSTWINVTRTLTGGAHNQNQSATIGVHSKNEILKPSNANLGHRHIYHFSHCSTEFITSWQKPAAGNETGHYAPFTFKSDNH